MFNTICSSSNVPQPHTRTCFLKSWHSSGVRVSAFAISGMTLTLSWSLFMNSMSSGFRLKDRKMANIWAKSCEYVNRCVFTFTAVLTPDRCGGLNSVGWLEWYYHLGICNMFSNMCMYTSVFWWSTTGYHHSPEQNNLKTGPQWYLRERLTTWKGRVAPIIIRRASAVVTVERLINAWLFKVNAVQRAPSRGPTKPRLSF